jgi:thiosulfate reductase cytochrome b subunit
MDNEKKLLVLARLDKKIKRIRLYKIIGKIIYSLILATLIIVILINLNCAMKTQMGPGVGEKYYQNLYV